MDHRRLTLACQDEGAAWLSTFSPFFQQIPSDGANPPGRARIRAWLLLKSNLGQQCLSGPLAVRTRFQVRSQLSRHSPGKRFNVAAGQSQTMIGCGTGNCWPTLHNAKPIHHGWLRRVGYPPASSKLSCVTHMPWPTTEEVGIETNDDVRLCEIVIRVQRFAKS